MLISGFMGGEFYSVRMRASRLRDHLSGAERLVPTEDVEAVAGQLVRRALNHERGAPDSIRLSLDRVMEDELRRARLPALRTLRVADYRQGRRAALELLREAGVAARAAEAAVVALADGPAPGGGTMRGALLMDAVTGRRLEIDPARGVRVSRMDLSAAAAKELSAGLAALGLDNPHVREALVLAGKVAATPEIVAELCWSDDPSYVAGYVASAELGYVRLTHLKPAGEERGGRAFFVRGENLNLHRLTTWLERGAVLFDEIGRLDGETAWEERRW